jgi:hypothetical protein
MVNCFDDIMTTPFMIYVGLSFHKCQTYEHFLPGVKSPKSGPLYGGG